MKVWICILGLTFSSIQMNGQALTQMVASGQPWENSQDCLSELGMTYGWSESVQLKSKPSHSEMVQGGFKTERYQQFVEGIPVLGGILNIHSKDENIRDLSGRLWSEPADLCQDQLTQFEVLDLVQADHVSFKTDHSRSTIESVWADEAYPEISGNLVKAWLLDWHSSEAHARRRILVDACSGRRIMDVNVIMTCFHGEDADHNHGVGPGGFSPTLYNGIQDVKGKFDAGLGGEILALEDGHAPVYTFKDDTTHFVDSGRAWMESDTAYLNGALDAHWGISETRDFFRNRYGRDGIKGNGDSIRSFIFPLDQPFNNAYWDGFSMFYGRGDSVTYGPFTSIDICAHEMTHGVTEFTAGLEYTYESGALNESISDIFGKTVEQLSSPTDFSWGLGDRIVTELGGQGFRSMSDPNNNGHPKYYKGRRWWTNRFDNGGVHINSGVLNYWFYLLVEGESGRAQGGEEFDVQAIGLDLAIDHVYTILTQYLTPTSQYADIRDASMSLARIEFENDPSKIESIAQAWYAVGLGYPIREKDLGLTAFNFNTTFCEGSDLFPKADIINQSFNDTVPALHEFEVAYVYRGDTTREIVSVKNPLLPGGVLSYTFQKPITDNRNGNTDLVVILNSDWDQEMDNNESTVRIARIPGLDFEVEAYPSRLSLPQCNRPTTTPVFFAGLYNGCTPIYSRDSFLMSIELYGKVEQRWIHPLRTVYPGAFVYFGEFDFEDIPYGTSKGSVTFSHKLDPVEKNNRTPFGIFRLDNSTAPFIEQFDSPQTIDSAFIVTECPEYHDHKIQIVDGESSLVIGGRGILDSDGEIVIDTNSKALGTFFIVNPDHITNIRICADVSQFIKPQLEFEVMRQKGDIDYIPFGTREGMASAIAVGFTGFIEYMANMPYDEFITMTYDLPKDEELVQIRLQNLVLTSMVDSVTGEILGGDRIVYKNVKLIDQGLHTIGSSEDTWQAVPNPASDKLTIVSKTGSLEGGEYKIVSTDGRIIEQWSTPRGIQEWTIDISGMPNTFYIIQSKEGSIMELERIVRIK